MTAEYSKGRDNLSSTKMNYCHYIFKDLFGSLLHRTIHISKLAGVDNPIRIADLGSETAIWPIDAAESSSFSVSVDCFDIASTSFPPPAWIPPNAQLHIHDVFKPFPEEFHGVFDIVHLRWWLSLSRDQIDTLVNSAAWLLKEGGYIQWTEQDKTQITAISATPGISMQATQKFVDLTKMPFPDYEVGWAEQIAPAMESAGFKVLAQERTKVRPSLYRQISEMHILALRDVPRGLSDVIDEFMDRWMDQYLEECQQGVATIDEFVTVVGEKQVQCLVERSVV
ncbi:hypothetical protein MMC15_007576 [Xylographa vitiligo]|nr:hypothetical protein [Xylographa vitiligo]